MTAFLAAVGLLEMPRAAFLGIAVLVMMIAADSPVADESLLDSTQPPLGFLGDTQSSKVFKPSALPDSQHTTERPEFLNPLPINSESTLQSWTTDSIRRQKSKPLILRDAVTEEPYTSELSQSLSNSSIASFSSSMSATSTSYLAVYSNEKMTSNSQQVVTSEKTVSCSGF
ncbi:hypothetical protein FQA47_017621 [Oryzias melastigma]|uniref:Uncharacterized protein n=1 Tax=Oryzias melastigma TaxID=30732 RepID=A0A834FN46_ORYME|nr:hypothetical protein FQA47_017621 [Oryzias melastigma]